MHTPGPWEVRSLFVGPYIVQSGDEQIAWVGNDSHDAAVANAQLIAAAPALLAMLKEFVHPHQTGQFTEAERNELALGVIAKAEGK